MFKINVLRDMLEAHLMYSTAHMLDIACPLGHLPFNNLELFFRQRSPQGLRERLYFRLVQRTTCIFIKLLEKVIARALDGTIHSTMLVPRGVDCFFDRLICTSFPQHLPHNCIVVVGS